MLVSLMETQSKKCGSPEAVRQTASYWRERSAEAREMADAAEYHEVKAVLEHIAHLYEALAKRTP
jgi:hypothetical protein